MDILAHPWWWVFAAFVAGFLIARSVYRAERSQPTPRSDIRDAEIDAALRDGRKVEAIGLYRAKHGSDLRSAAEAVRERAVQLGLHP